jgi:putative hydrolase of HD superfamily
VSAEEKSKREAKAINTLLAERPDLAALWHQYEAQDTPEARFVREADRLDMALQAVRYAREHGVDTAEFVDSAMAVVQHPVLLAVLKRT